MTLETNELYKEASRNDDIRLFPAEGGVVPRMFAAVSGGATYPKGTPVAFNTSTSKWVVFAQGGANGVGTISGILFEEITVNDSGSDDTETLANVMILGRLHRNDVNTAAIRALLTSTSEAQLDTALRAPSMREKGLHTEGLSLVQ